MPGLDQAGQAPNVGNGGEIAQPEWGMYFGNPNPFVPPYLDTAGKDARVTHNLPVAYLGKSEIMESIMEESLVGMDWYTDVVLPYEKHDGNPNIKFLVVKNDMSYMDVEPYGSGNVKYVTSSISTVGDTMVQRGMAMQVQRGFWKTEEGKKMYGLSLKSIIDSRQLTVNQLVISAILRTKSVYNNFDLLVANKPTISIREALNITKTRWAAVNKGMGSVRKLVADICEVMKSNSVNPGVFILPPKTKIMMALTHESETDYGHAGKFALEARTKGGAAVDKFMGLKTYETTSFASFTTGADTDPLKRQREYGSFFWITNYHRGNFLSTYRSEERFAAKIMDASKDGQETLVTGKQCLRYCNRFASDGSLSHYHHELIASLRSLRTTLGDNSTTEVDMFIGYDPSVDVSSAEYHVMEYFGEMRENDLSNSTLKDFAATCTNSLMRVMSDADVKFLRNYSEFTHKLGDIVLESDAKYYLMAIALSGTIPGAENLSVGDRKLFADNGSGCVNPPYVGSGGLGIKVNGKRQTIIFAHTQDGSIHCILEDQFLANGEKEDIPGWTQDMAEELNTPLLIFNALMQDKVIKWKDQGTYYKVVKNQFTPLGFGHPTGIRTLSNMFRTGDTRGYSTEVLAEADAHYQALEKFFSVWKCLFPNHELGDSKTCPSYFKTENTKDDEICSFAHNLYGHTQYPAFTIPPRLEKNGYSFASSASDTLTYAVAPEDIEKTWIAKFLRTAQVHTAQQIKEQLSVVATSPGISLEELFTTAKNPEIKNTLTKGYRANPSNQPTLAVFLDDVLFRTEGPRLFRVAVEILQSDASSIDWATEFARALALPTSLPRGPSNRTAQVSAFNKNRIDAINTKICINPKSFKQYAQQISMLFADPNENSSDNNAVVLQNLLCMPMRPMNIMFPSYALGGSFTLQNASDAVEVFGLAAAPAGRNTAYALTNSKFNAAHTRAAQNATSSHNRKRTPVTSSSSSRSKRRVTSDGILIQATSRDSVYAVDDDDVLDAIPQGKRIYGGGSDGSETDPSLSINLLQDSSVRLFKLDDKYDSSATSYRKSLISRFHHFAKETDPIVRIFAQSCMTSKIHCDTCDNWYDNNCIVPIAFECFRIRQGYWMGSGAVLEPGVRLGNVYHGQHDFQWSDDIIRGLHTGKYSVLLAAIIKRPELIALLEDIVAMGYIGGESVTFITTPEEFELLLSNPRASKGDILVKMVPYDRPMPPSPQDIGGKFNYAVTSQLDMDGVSTFNPIHGNSAFYYELIYGLAKINGAYSPGSSFNSSANYINTICFTGHHRIYQPGQQQWKGIILDEGRFGPSVYKGCISDRDISGNVMKEVDFAALGCEIYC